MRLLVCLVVALFATCLSSPGQGNVYYVDSKVKLKELNPLIGRGLSFSRVVQLYDPSDPNAYGFYIATNSIAGVDDVNVIRSAHTDTYSWIRIDQVPLATDSVYGKFRLFSPAADPDDPVGYDKADTDALVDALPTTALELADYDWSDGSTNQFSVRVDVAGTPTWRPIPYAHVAAFGATGDGVTDDTAAIQGALNNVTSGTLFFGGPDKTYVVDGTDGFENEALILTNNLRLLGNGAKLKFKDQDATHTLLVLDGTRHATIEGLTFDGNLTSVRNLSGNFLLRDAGQFTRIVNCNFTNANAGLVVASALPVTGDFFPSPATITTYGAWVDSCFFSDIATSPIITKSGGSSFLNIVNNKLTRFGGAGIHIDGQNTPSDGTYARQAVIMGNVLYDADTSFKSSSEVSGQGAITIEEGFEDVLVVGNTIRGLTNSTYAGSVEKFSAFKITPSSQTDKPLRRVTISDTIIENVDGRGFYIIGQTNGVTEHLTIDGATMRNIGLDGFKFSTSHGTNIIQHVTIRNIKLDTANNGFQTDWGVDDIHLENVEVRNTVLDGVRLSNNKVFIDGLRVIDCNTSATSGEGGLYLVACDDAWVQNVFVDGHGAWHNIYIDQCDEVDLMNVTSRNAPGAGLRVEDSTYVTVSNPSFTGNSTGIGGSGTVDNLTITGGFIRGSTKNMDLPSGWTNVDIIGTKVSGGSTYDLDLNSGTAEYTLTKAGVATIADTQSTVVVTHGLPTMDSAAADLVAVAVSSSLTEPVAITARAATTFTISRTGTSGALTVFWYASYQP